MVRLVSCFILVSAGSAWAQGWAATFPSARVATYFNGAERTAVVVIPAGDPASGARDAALALKAAIDESGKASSCTVGADDPRGDDLVVVRQVSVKADVALVVRVFPTEGAASMVVVSFFAPDGTTLSAVTGVRGLPIEARATEKASSVGVSREARKSISTVLEADEAAAGEKSKPPADAPEKPVDVTHRRFEVTVAPVGLPIPFGTPGDFGSLVRVGYQFTPVFGAYLSGFLRWLRTDAAADTNRQLSDATSVDGHLGLGVAFVPVRLPFLLVALRAGLALAATSVELRPLSTGIDGALRAASYGSSGLRPMGQLGLEVAFVLSPMVRIGLEVRNAFMSSATTAVNGCTGDDLRAMDIALRAGRPVTSVGVGAGCAVGSFDGTDASGVRRSNDVPLAQFRLREPGGLANRLSIDLSVTLSF